MLDLNSAIENAASYAANSCLEVRKAFCRIATAGNKVATSVRTNCLPSGR